MADFKKPSDEELAELKARPPGTNADFTARQLQLRRKIAQDMCQNFLDNDETLTPEFRKIYEEWPMWKFYQRKDTKLPRRTYGVAVAKDGATILHTASAMLFWVNYTVGGTLAADLEPVDAWTDEQIDQINACGNPGMFLDPLGFWIALQDNAC